MITGETIANGDNNADKTPEQTPTAEQLTQGARAEAILAVLDAYDAQQIDDYEMFDLLSDYSMHHRSIIGGSPCHTTLKRHLGIMRDNWLANEQAKLAGYDQAIERGQEAIKVYEEAIEGYSHAINTATEPTNKEYLHSQLEQLFEVGKLEATKQHDKMRHPVVAKNGKKQNDNSAAYFSQLMQVLTDAKRVLDAEGEVKPEKYLDCIDTINQLLLAIAQEDYVKTEHELYDLKIGRIGVETAIELDQEIFDRDADKRKKLVTDLLLKIRRTTNGYL